MALLEVRNVSKKYGQQFAVDHISFQLAEGRCVALLGQNGAGKTTSLKMIAGMIKPSEGEIQFEGIKPGEDRRKYIGYLPQYPAFYHWMSGSEYLHFVGKLAFVSRNEVKERAEELLHLVGLQEAGDRKIGGYSGGMKQRLGIAQAMIHRPKLLMLDEPVSSLDPVGRREVLEMMHQLKKKTTILFSTHVLHDAEDVSDDIMIMHRGQMAIQGSLKELRDQHQQAVIYIEAEEGLEAKVKEWRTWKEILDIEIERGKAKIMVENLVYTRQKLLEDIARSGLLIRKYEVGRTTLEDLFMKVVKA